ncbi:Transducin/WD40 repeat-like superfamily protein [Abeliophyllum distichum]|uniref:Transducin/WD40 repeat-like superfamily protein n=1 Tax=Abeliophyllum distichum TaxID=126358 RepID=A0ABD1RXH1_9LAMI
METASFLDPPNSPPNVSFALRGTHTNNFLRSVSTKEPSLTEAPCTPPRLSTATSLSINLHGYSHSQPSTPRFSFTPSKLDDLDSTYRCICSVLKKDGQILSVATSSGLVYTGSQGNTIRIWKLPEFTECGQLKTKACMVVALEASNDRIYAAYSDCKIRVWRRTWEGVIKHIRLATIPKTGSYVQSYITGKDKMAHPEPINAIVVADDGVLYTASDDATVRVWRRNFCSGSRPHSLTVTLSAKYSPVKTLALTLDGGVLYGGCTDGYVHYWLKGWFSGQLQYGGALTGHTHAVMCLANMANYVVSGSADSTSRVWIREQDGQHSCIAVLQGHRGPIRCVAAFPKHDSGEGTQDGCTICTGSIDGVLKVWRVINTSQNRDSSKSAREYFELA